MDKQQILLCIFVLYHTSAYGYNFDDSCSEPEWFKCRAGKCIHFDFVCDGKADCHLPWIIDTSDEEQCANFKGSDRKHRYSEYEHPDEEMFRKFEWRCANGQTTPLNYFCDGAHDCYNEDHSDEPPGCSKVSVEAFSFECDSNECLDWKLICNDHTDCEDGYSDERNCEFNGWVVELNSTSHNTVPPLECLKSEFLCKSGNMCINASQVCDKHLDCPDNSDEFSGCDKSCTNKNTCSQGCIPNPDITKLGTCYCFEGYEMSDMDKCEDIDECEQFGSCSQLCKNLNKTFQCSCIDGFQLSKDNTSCELIEDNATLVFTIESKVQLLNLAKENNISYSPVENIGHPYGVTFDARNEYIFWNNENEYGAEIWKSRINGSGKEIVVSTGLSDAHTIAYDWIGGNLYFTDVKQNHIGVCSNGQELCGIIIQQNYLKGLSGNIAIHPNLGLIFWTVGGNGESSQSIMKAGLDGSFPHELISSHDMISISGLTIDHANSRIYWVDSPHSKTESLDSIHHQRVKTAKLDGTDIRHLALGPSTPGLIDIIGDKLYFSDLISNEIRVTNKIDPNGQSTSIVKELTEIKGFTIIHKANQPISRKNHCADAGCSHICTLTPNQSFRCVCPPGMELVNSKTCFEMPSTPKLLIGHGNIFKTTRLNSIGKSVIDEFPLPDESYSIGAIAYNRKNATVIFSDNLKKTIFYFDLKSKKVSVLVDQDVESVSGLDFDGIGDNLYWVDDLKRTIEVISLVTKAKLVLEKEIYRPVDILLVPDEGVFFVATIDLHGGMILMFSMDGYSREVRYRDSKAQPISLAFNHALQQVYWVDANSNSIQYIPIKAQSSKSAVGASTLLIPKEGKAVSLAVYAMDIFWTDRSNNQIVHSYKEDFMKEGRPIIFGNHLMSNKTVNFKNSTRKSPVTKLTVVNQQLDFKTSSSLPHPCEKNNNPCSHLCLMGRAHLTSTCHCPEGLHLDKHGHTCVPIDGYLNITKNGSSETDSTFPTTTTQKPIIKESQDEHEVEKSFRSVIIQTIELILLTIGVIILIVFIVIIFRRKFLNDRVSNPQIRSGQPQFTANFDAHFTSRNDALIMQEEND